MYRCAYEPPGIHVCCSFMHNWYRVTNYIRRRGDWSGNDISWYSLCKFVDGLRLNTAESQKSFSFIGDFFFAHENVWCHRGNCFFLHHHPSLTFLPVFFLLEPYLLSSYSLLSISIYLFAFSSFLPPIFLIFPAINFCKCRSKHVLVRKHDEFKGGYTLLTLLRIVTPYRDSVDGTLDRVTCQKLVTR
jgi:hypothetical protein